jgi:peptidoglycan/LPS O-acetylase OafA/YrhL
VRSAVATEDGASRGPDTTPNSVPSSSALGTRQPGLDGIRAVAVLAVLAFHGGLPWSQGGYLGVSLFFTLSGFLITGLLLRNNLVPGGDLRAFWARRFRRLMPAAFAALGVVVVFGATVATRQQVVDLPGQVAAAATWTVNWLFIATGTSYIGLFAAPSPVQHFWSLAIEEQFYLILPLVLFVLVRRTRSPRVLMGVLAGAALLSSAWMAFLFEHGASLDRLYYGTDTRVAELLTGAALGVFIWGRGIDFSSNTRRMLVGPGLLAFALVLWSCANVALTDDVLWRGGFLLFSLAACTLILAVLGGRGPLVSVLSLAPIVAIGRISYGVYLYHWPIFLWLTEERTGLTLWPLFALRVAITFALAILSFFALERPVMRGATFGVRGRARFALVPVAAVVVIAATMITVNRSASDPLATLDAGTTSGAVPRAANDRVLDLLVVPGQADDPVVEQIAAMGRTDPAVKVTVAPPFECSGGLVASEHGRTCANWLRSWPALVKRHDPDAVLLYADGWAGQGLGKLTGAAPQAQAQAAVKILAPGLDMLTARGAPVIWSTSGTDFSDAVRRSLNPFNQAMALLRAQRSDLVEVEGGQLPDPATVSPEDYASRSASVLVDDASLHRRATGDALPRVMVVGDSQALSLGFGLDQWTAKHKRAVVWNHGINGCGVAVEGEKRTFGLATTELERCHAAVRAWPKQLEAFDPDVVIVLSSLNDIQDRRLPGASDFTSIGDRRFDTLLLQEYERVVDTLSSTGARVVWMTPPCTSIKAVPGQPVRYPTERIARLNSTILTKLARARSGSVTLFDLAGEICPDGKPLESVDGVGTLRPDGVHFSIDGSLWYARTYGEKLLEAGGI